MSTALGAVWAGDAHERWAELAVGHALHALEPDDEAAFLAHLRGCAACHLVVEDATAVAGELAFGAGPETPPEGLRRRLREAMGADDPAPAPAQPSEADGTPEPGAAPPPRALPAPGETDDLREGPLPDHPSAPAATPRRGSHRAPRGTRGLGDLPRPGGPRPPGGPGRPGGRGRVGGVVPWLAAAAAVVGLVAVVATGAGVRAERDRLATAVAAQEAVLDRLTDPEASVVRLGPTRGGDGAGMTAAVLVDGGDAWVVTDGLPPNDPAATTYVLWALPQAGDPVPMGVFDVAAGGLQVAALGAPGAAVGDPAADDLALGDLAALAVSREDGRTAPPAPSTPLLVGTPA